MFGGELDQFILRQVNETWAHPWLDGVMALVSDFGLFKIPLGIAAVILLWKGRFKERFLVGLIALTVLCGDAGICNGLKHQVKRPRPHEALAGIRLVTLDQVVISHPGPVITGSSSFPSAHVANNVAVALIVTTFYGRKARWIWLLPVVMTYSRVYVGSHYPSDVLASWGIALTYTTFILWLVRKYAPEWWTRAEAVPRISA